MSGASADFVCFRAPDSPPQRRNLCAPSEIKQKGIIHLNLLKELQRKRGLTYLFVAHDMSVIRYISDRVGVMYLGHLVEEGDTDEVFDHPQHPYTRTLMSAVPSIDPRDNRQRILLEGDLPSPIDPPSGCVFHTRCPWATEACKTASCESREVRAGHYAACSRGERE